MTAQDFSDATAERMVIGACLASFEVDFVAALGDGIRAGYFSDPMAAVVWGILCELDADREPFDIGLIVARMPRAFRGRAVPSDDDCRAFLFEAMKQGNLLPAGGIDGPIRAVIRAAERRAVSRASADIADIATRPTVAKPFRDAEVTLARIASEFPGSTRAKTFSEALTSAIDGSGNDPVQLLGVRALDDPHSGLGGVPRGSLVLVAGRPQAGKSTFLHHIARRFAEAGGKVGVVTLELDATKVAADIAAAGCGVERRKLKGDGRWSPTAVELERLSTYGARMAPQVSIADSLSGWHAVRAAIVRMVAVGGCGLVIVDYLQRVVVPGLRSEYEEVRAVSRGLKDLARELRVPVIAGAQINRETERAKRKDGEERPPQMSDLHGGGPLEQDADSILALWGHRDEDDSGTSVRLRLLKNRHGWSGFDCDYTWRKPFMRFVEGDEDGRTRAPRVDTCAAPAYAREEWGADETF